MIKYKLTDSGGFTKNHTEWKEGASYKTSGKGDLCSKGWLHCYDSPLLAVLLNPIHANFTNPKICKVECGGEMKIDKGLKLGFTEMAFVEWTELPILNPVHRVAFSILCAKEVNRNESWNTWADKWLNGEDRSKVAAYAAADAADNAAYAADAAAYAAAAYAAYAATYAADAAAYAVYAAADAAAINLIELAEKAIQIK